MFPRCFHIAGAGDSPSVSRADLATIPITSASTAATIPPQHLNRHYYHAGSAIFATSRTLPDSRFSLYLRKHHSVSSFGRSSRPTQPQGRLTHLIIHPDQMRAGEIQGGGVRVEHGNALVAALLNGESNVVQLLLEHGADVNVPGGNYGTALKVAALLGYEKIVRLLLGGGADVTTNEGFWYTALEGATKEDRDKVVRLLLERDTHVNAQKDQFLLLEKGADVNAQGGDFGNALQAASMSGQEGIVRLLLDRGADINARAGCGDALQAAAYHGHTKVVKLLLDYGADAKAPRGLFGTALQAATRSGNERVIQMVDKAIESDRKDLMVPGVST
ncbi:uncharacterized protein PV07_08697 [Cladophialophora immunda]|uniref:Uncharacterized protein n=1 Tax=Cladophialophora immunda TaxID=569365 RepID=A0A0D1ZCT8_9EURO|nr:uncharacterized protein PV07_08697 [Cladophialophora immunda]KIW25531.1 hypothetical protein PV07_08697 [Cladophialophora immunda]